MGFKVCSTCKENKDTNLFYKNKSNSSGFTSQCKNCADTSSRGSYNKNRKKRLDNSKNWRVNNKDRRKDSHLKRVYGITLEKYNEMLLYQHNLCGICEQPENAIGGKDKKHIQLSIDHDHKTGRVRGLLCNNCNRGLGLLKENVEYLQNAILYLEDPNVF